MEELLICVMPFLSFGAALAFSIRVVWFLFSKAETVVTSQTRYQVSRWLWRLDPVSTMERWPKTFAALFDSVFGERHLSWRCIWRSCVASLTGVVILTLVWASIYPDGARNFFITFQGFGLLFLGLGLALFNLVPDYLSLLETRYVLRWMGTKPSTRRICALLAFDIVVTGVIFFCTAVLITAFILIWGSGINIFLKDISGPLEGMWEAHVAGFRLSSVSEEDFPSFGIFIYSTYFTSVWMLLYALSGIVLILGRTLLRPGVSLMQRYLDIDNQPIRALGYVASVIVTLIYLVVWIIL